jgi:hypothetical protein
MQYFNLGGGNSIRFATGTAVPTVDPDAQAFITAAAITNPTQQSAVNQLVVDLKGYGVWTKMKALYPFCGGSASSHKFNLKDPRDLDAAFRLVFNGGWTHSANGALPNGVNGFADTFLANNVLAQNSNHISAYSRTNSNTTSSIIASWNSTFGVSIYPRNVAEQFQINNNAPTGFSVSNVDSRGFFLNSRTASNSLFSQKNTVQSTSTVSSTNHITTSFKLSRTGDFAGEYSNREIAFASIGDGLTDTEASNFYTAVQTFQTTLGRSIGTQTVSDADAQAFVTNAGIVDQVEANAVNNLVIGMKADGVWSKMKAIYPFVGGTASTHKFNLKNPLDTDAAFRLVFNGGWTHSSTGAQPNGTNGFADTKISLNTLLRDNNSTSIYSRTDLSSGADFGVLDPTGGSGTLQLNSKSTNLLNTRNASLALTGFTNTNSAGFFQMTRRNSSSYIVSKNVSKTTINTISSDIAPWSNNNNIPIAALNAGGNISGYSNRQYAFMSIGNTSLNDVELDNFYTAVQTFQTALNRQIP